MKNKIFFLLVFIFIFSFLAIAQDFQIIYSLGKFKPVNTVLSLKVGDRSPDFSLPSVWGEEISLKQYSGKKNVMISFVSAAWTPVCTNQIYDYTFYEDIFSQNDAVILLISVDNIPILYAWTKSLTNLWYPVLSDFSPHGAVAQKYGVLRPEGFAEQAIFVVDKQGVIRYININDINLKPNLSPIFKILEKLT